jgi:hypothetical protein
MRGPVAVRLAKRTVRDGDCLRWTGSKTKTGYGRIGHEGKTKSVHRVAYELAKGPIPEGLEIDHLCRVRDCVNPAHLEAVTHTVNVQRAAAMLTPIEACKYGHPSTEESRDPNCRSCRVCHKIRNARRIDCEFCGQNISACNKWQHAKGHHPGKVPA